MRRSAGMGKGSVLRTVGRAVGSGVAGVKEAVSSTAVGRAAKPARVAALSSRSGSSGSSSAAIAAAATRGSALCFCDGEEWETVEVEEGDMEERFERFVFGPVPSTQEAEEAVSAIQQITDVFLGARNPLPQPSFTKQLVKEPLCCCPTEGMPPSGWNTCSLVKIGRKPVAQLLFDDGKYRGKAAQLLNCLANIEENLDSAPISNPNLTTTKTLQSTMAICLISQTEILGIVPRNRKTT